MYMGKQYKNEAGNNASRQVKCGTRQEMKIRGRQGSNQKTSQSCDSEVPRSCFQQGEVIFSCGFYERSSFWLCVWSTRESRV